MTPTNSMIQSLVDALWKTYNIYNVDILITALWYISTTSSNTKYVYEESTPVVSSRNKNVINVSETKTIHTPVYDINKVRIVKVEKLIQRKKGWTYSHSFQVHGHYRHYKDGRVIFIKSFEKGKNTGKEFMAQTIRLEPDKIKEP